MSNPYTYEIRIEGHLTDFWSDWFGGLAIRYDTGGETILSGILADQAALIGMLSKIQALNLTIISVTRLSSASRSKCLLAPEQNSPNDPQG
jgi:hypothetical protein